MDPIILPGDPNWPQARIDRVYRAIERNEHWAELVEWREKVETAKRKGYPLPVGGGLYKARWDLSQGGAVSTIGSSGWEIDDLPVADFLNVTVPATTGIVKEMFSCYPLVNPFTALGSPDNEPFQDGSGLLTAVKGDRQVGSPNNPLLICAGCFVVHATSGGAVLNPAATLTFNLRVLNAVAATSGGFTTEATLNVTTAANIIDQAPIVATTGRALSTPDAVQRAIFAIFNGDSLWGELANTNAGAFTTGANVLAAMLELM